MTSYSGPGLGSVAVPESVSHTVRGRDALLAELAGLSGHVVVLHAAGGHGKTTVAAAFAGLVGSRVRVWWVDATSAQSVSEGLREVAVRAGAPQAAVRSAWAGEGSAPDLLWDALRALRDPWLLVLDNADDASVLSPGGRGWLRQPSLSGTVLVTSRDGRPGRWGRAELRAVPTLDEADGAVVLADLAPDAGSVADAAALVVKLGGLPLALRLAGRYLGVAGRSPRLPGATQPRTFVEYAKALEADFARTSAAHPPGYPVADRELLTRTWELSLDFLAARGRPLARRLMRLLSTLAPAPIPTALLDAGWLAESPLFEGITGPELEALVTDLIGLGLIEYRPGEVEMVALHPLVREANRHQPDAYELQAEYAAALLVVVDNAVSELDYSDLADWPLWRALLSHCTDLPDVTPDDQRLVKARIQHRTADVSDEFALTGQAEALYRAALAVLREVLGDEHELTLTTRHNLAWLLRRKGQLSEAEREASEILSLRNRLLGPEHNATLATRAVLARIYYEKDEIDRAEQEFRATLDIRSRLFGPEHGGVLICRHELALIALRRGDLARAESELRQVHEISSRLNGAESPNALTTRVEHAYVLSRQGDYETAEAELRAILSVDERLFGPDHPDTLTTLYNLASVLCDKGDFRQAEALLTRVVKGRRQQLSATHRDTTDARDFLTAVRERLASDAS